MAARPLAISGAGQAGHILTHADPSTQTNPETKFEGEWAAPSSIGPSIAAEILLRGLAAARPAAAAGNAGYYYYATDTFALSQSDGSTWHALTPLPPDSGVVAGSYGSATEVSVFAVDSTGRVTSASSVSIATAIPSGDATSDPVTAAGQIIIDSPNTEMLFYTDDGSTWGFQVVAASTVNGYIGSRYSGGPIPVAFVLVPAAPINFNKNALLNAALQDVDTGGVDPTFAGQIVTDIANFPGVFISYDGVNWRQIFDQGSAISGDVTGTPSATVVQGAENITSNVKLTVAGKKVEYKQAAGGADAAGILTLVGGTKTVNTTAVETADILSYSVKTAGGTIGTAYSYTIINGTSFTITSNNPLDTSTIGWHLIGKV